MLYILNIFAFFFLLTLLRLVCVSVFAFLSKVLITSKQLIERFDHRGYVFYYVFMDLFFELKKSSNFFFELKYLQFFFLYGSFHTLL